MVYSRRTLAKLYSMAGTGYIYYFRRLRTAPKMTLVKYDPIGMAVYIISSSSARGVFRVQATGSTNDIQLAKFGLMHSNPADIFSILYKYVDSSIISFIRLLGWRNERLHLLAFLLKRFRQLGRFIRPLFSLLLVSWFQEILARF